MVDFDFLQQLFPGGEFERPLSRLQDTAVVRCCLRGRSGVREGVAEGRYSVGVDARALLLELARQAYGYAGGFEPRVLFRIGTRGPKRLKSFEQLSAAEPHVYDRKRARVPTRVGTFDSWSSAAYTEEGEGPDPNRQSPEAAHGRAR